MSFLWYAWHIREIRTEIWKALCFLGPASVWLYSIFTSEIQNNNTIIGYTILYGAIGLLLHNIGYAFVYVDYKSDKGDFTEFHEKWDEGVKQG